MAATTTPAGSMPGDSAEDSRGLYRDMNQALLLGSIRQHELAEMAEQLNAQLKIEIAQRRQTEAALQSLAAIIECSEDAIMGEDLEGSVTSWNQGAEKIFGYHPDEMVGTSIMRLLPGHLREQEQEILAKIKKGERVQHFETRRQTRDGRVIDVSITASPSGMPPAETSASRKWPATSATARRRRKFYASASAASARWSPPVRMWCTG